MGRIFDKLPPPAGDEADGQASAAGERCPRCGGEMERGFVQSAREIFWGRSMHKARFGPNEGKGEFYLPQARGCPAFSGVCPADYCAACGLVLIRTREEEAP